MSFESDGDAQDDHDDALDHAHYQGSQRNEEKLVEASSNDKIGSLYHLLNGKMNQKLTHSVVDLRAEFLLRQP